MKFLCVCDGGNVRSQGLAYVLHDLMGQEAVAVGRLRVSPETLEYFCEWADIVVCMQECMAESVPMKFRDKVRVVDVGVDRFGVYVHPELLEMVTAGANWLLEQGK